jgi:hypothetical protein
MNTVMAALCAENGFYGWDRYGLEGLPLRGFQIHHKVVISTGGGFFAAAVERPAGCSGLQQKL